MSRIRPLPPAMPGTGRQRKRAALVHQAFAVQQGAQWGKRAHGWSAQGLARTTEERVRRAVLAVARWARDRVRLPSAKVAAALGLHATTVAHWRKRRANSERQRQKPRGKRPADVSIEQRNAVYEHLTVSGAERVSVRILCREFPDVPRAVLAEFRDRFGAMWRRKHRRLIHVLRWPRVGAVWAMDLKEFPHLLDGCFRYAVVIRDLASGRTLAWRLVPRKTGALIAAVLCEAFAEHGAPLVIKWDNGSEFDNDEVERLLAAHAILPLWSPPGTPSYNGSAEAGIGGLAARAFWHAARHDRPYAWTCDDWHWAAEHANANARPRGLDGPTPDEAWAARTPLSAAERIAFRTTVAREVRAHREAEWPGPIPPDTPFDPFDERRLGRAVLPRALREHEYLRIRRRRLPLPISRRKSS